MQLPKKILIFGATSSIAFETAKLFAKDRASFYLCGRNEEKLRYIRKDLISKGAQEVIYSTFDALDENSIKRCINDCLTKFPDIDGLFIAYGVLPDQKLCNKDMDEIKKAININFISVVLILTYIMQHFENQRSGVIVVISSVAGDRGRESNYIYGSTKGALSIFLEGLRQKLFKSGVRVLTVKPGFVNTPMTANYKKNFLFVEPEIVARGIYEAVKTGKDVVYLPWFWRWIMMIIRHIPEKIFKRIRL